MANLELIDIKNNKKNIKELKKLYKEAFPKDERVPFPFLRLLARKNRAEFYGIYDKDIFIGLMYNIYYKDIVYVFYFAIDKKFRGNGYGSEALKFIKEKYNQNRIILLIEEMDENSKNYQERIKRKNFYHSNGFKDFNYKVKELNVIYDMLGYNKENKKVSSEEYKDLMKFYWGKLLYKSIYEKINNMSL